jgi:hypothetical protein
MTNLLAGKRGLMPGCHIAEENELRWEDPPSKTPTYLSYSLIDSF